MGTKIVMTGGAGFIGLRLARALLARSEFERIEKLTLFDVAPPPERLPEDSRLEVLTGDIADAGQVRRVIDDSVDGVFHLGAIVSGGAEADFDLGYRVNLDGTRHVLEACRALPHKPRVVYASSLAVYGGEKVITDRTPLTPQTSYGVQKACGELLLNDYTRKGFVDGRGLRLPTIVVRAGKPNKAASTFASSIIREPLQGDAVVCPVPPETLMPVLSPRRVVDAFLSAYLLDPDALGSNRSILLGGLCPTVGEMVDALGQLAGERAVQRIRWVPDAAIQRIVDTWPQRLAAERAAALGFKHDDAFTDLIHGFIEDELDGQIAP